MDRSGAADPLGAGRGGSGPLRVLEVAIHTALASWMAAVFHAAADGVFTPMMTQAIRLFMLFEATTFIAASLVHSGALITGYEHREARIAERVIAIALLAGLALTRVRLRWTRVVGLAAQGFALVGTLVGVFTIAIGIGPRTAPDIAYHIGIVVVLASGLVVAARARSGEARQRP